MNLFFNTDTKKKFTKEEQEEEISVLNKMNDHFNIPIFYNKDKVELQENIATDLELVKTIDPSGSSIYSFYFNNDNVVSKKISEQVVKYYTTDTTFLEENKTFLKKYVAINKNRYEFNLDVYDDNTDEDNKRKEITIVNLEDENISCGIIIVDKQTSEGNIQSISNYKSCLKCIDQQNDYKVGDMVNVLLEEPQTILGKKQPTKFFRIGDLRLEKRKRKVLKVLYYYGPIPYRYLIEGLPNASYTEHELKQV